LNAIRVHTLLGILRRTHQRECLAAARYSHPVDKTTGVRSDHTVILTAIDSRKAYPDSCAESVISISKQKKRLKFFDHNFLPFQH